VVELKDATKYFDFGDEIEVDLTDGVVRNISKNKEYKTQPFPEFLQSLVSSSGLVEFVKKSLRD